MAGVRLTESVGNKQDGRPGTPKTLPPSLRMRKAPGASLRLALVLGRDGWAFLLALMFGLLAAVVLLSSVPLYDSLIANVQLQSAINTGGPASRNIDVTFLSNFVASDFAATEDQYLEPLARRYIGSFTRPNPVRSFSSARFPVVSATGTHPETVTSTNEIAVLSAYNYTVARSHIRLVAGVLPQPRAPGTTALDALIPQQFAQALGLRVGDQIQLGVPDRTQAPITCRVAGIWQPDASDPFWNERSFYYVVPGVNKDSAYTTILVDPVAFLSGLSTLRQVSMVQDWVYTTEPTRITTNNMLSVQNDIATLQNRLAQTHPLGLGVVQVAMTTKLDKSIGAVVKQLSLLTFPLFVVAALVVGLALLFIALMASLQAERQSSAIATLKSRGASNAQVLSAYTMLALVLCVIAIAAGPWLAELLSVHLAVTLIPASTLAAAGVTEEGLWRLLVPSSAVVPALVAAGLGATAMLVAVGQAARLQVVTLRRRAGRSEGAPLWQRLYLDVWLAVLCVLGYLDLNVFGGLGARETLGTQTASPLLLATPALLLLAGMLLLLRLLPVLANLGLALAARLRGATGTLAFAQIARSPSIPARLLLLLGLGLSVGLFALVFDASVTRNAIDRAAYQAGADFRIVLASSISGDPAARAAERMAGWPGVQSVTPVYRGNISTASESSAQSVGLLALDSRTWATTSGAWRSDYADQPISTLMAQMQAHVWHLSASDTSAQVGDDQHPIWAIVSQTFASSQHVSVGSHIALTISDATQQTTVFVVGGVVRDFPTMYDTQSPTGYVIMDIQDYVGLRASPVHGPDEFWLRSGDDPKTLTALRQHIQQDTPALSIIDVQDRRAIADQIAHAPLQAGVRGLLVLGALVAGVLLLLACIIQAAFAARQRTLQFAILRSLGVSRGQLVRQLLTEQVFIYAFGLVAGTILGVVLTYAALPFLEFSDTPVDPTTIGIPPYLVAWPPTNLALLYASVVVGLAVALLIAGAYASRRGIGRVLRIGED